MSSLRVARYCSRPATPNCRRANSRTGSSPIACRCASSCNCTNTCGAMNAAADDNAHARKAVVLAWAEVLDARDIFIGVNAVDYSGYPDCRPAFIAAFETLAALATKAGVEGARFAVRTPLMQMSKAAIIAAGTRLGVNYGDTVSCYQADAEGRACGRCDACRLRRAGFTAAGRADPTRYQR